MCSALFIIFCSVWNYVLFLQSVWKVATNDHPDKTLIENVWAGIEYSYIMFPILFLEVLFLKYHKYRPLYNFLSFILSVLQAPTTKKIWGIIPLILNIKYDDISVQPTYTFQSVTLYVVILVPLWNIILNNSHTYMYLYTRTLHIISYH